MNDNDLEEILVETPDKPKRGQRATPRSSRAPIFIVLGCLLLLCLCCLLPLCLLGMGGLTIGSAAAVVMNNEATESGSEQVAVNADEPIVLTVENSVGQITIQPGSSEEVVVEYTKRAYGWTKDDANAQLKTMDVKVDQINDRSVRVNVEYSKNDFDFGLNAVDLTITVPRDVALIVDNNTGDIQVEGVRARSLKLESNTGEITFDGDLAASGDFSIRSNTGEITVRLPQDAYVQVSATTDVGEVNVSGFDVSNDESRRDGPGVTFSGTLGSGPETPPTLNLHLSVGSISIRAQ